MFCQASMRIKMSPLSVHSQINCELYFLKVERFSFGNVKMGKLSEPLLSTNIPH